MIGLASFGVSQKKDPVPQPGPPFASNSANNGLSVDAVTGKIVLGNDVGDPASPAALLSPREIVDGGGANPVTFQDAVAAAVQNILSSIAITMLDVATGSFIDLRNTGGGGMRALLTTNGGIAIIAAVDTLGAQAGCNVGGGTPVVFCTNALQSFGMTPTLNVLNLKSAGGAGNGIEIDPVANDMKSTGTLSSDAPSANGAGKWKLGKFVAGAVAPDAANYVEVLVDGVIRKLIVAV